VCVCVCVYVCVLEFVYQDFLRVLLFCVCALEYLPPPPPPHTYSLPTLTFFVPCPLPLSPHPPPSFAQEPKAERQIYKHPKDFLRYTQTRLMRVYPGPLRVDSSNFNPSLYWAVGCQMVALNFQTAGVATQLNQVCCAHNDGVCVYGVCVWGGGGAEAGPVVDSVVSTSRAARPTPCTRSFVLARWTISGISYFAFNSRVCPPPPPIFPRTCSPPPHHHPLYMRVDVRLGFGRMGAAATC
jgi:hypothetical protein